MIEGALGERFALAGRRVYVAGHRGMVGSALVCRLQREDCLILTVDRQRCDLRRQEQTERWLAEVRPDVMAAAELPPPISSTTT